LARVVLAVARGRAYTRPMKTLVTSLALCALLVLPVQAEVEGAPPTVEESTPRMFDLFERMLRGFMTEVEPQMRELERGFTEMEPELQRFLQQLRDMTQFHPPEIQPNGDILIRRRQAEDVVPDSDESMPDEDASGDTSADPFEL